MRGWVYAAIVTLVLLAVIQSTDDIALTVVCWAALVIFILMVVRIEKNKKKQRLKQEQNNKELVSGKVATSKLDPNADFDLDPVDLTDASAAERPTNPNLVSCKECGHHVAKAARTCPSCGVDAPAPTPKPGETPVGGAAVLALVALAFWYFGFYESEEDKQEAVAAAVQEAKDEALAKERGWHCLSGWDGSLRSVVQATKAGLKDPDSFEHIETRLGPKDENGNHLLAMKYRAKNGFGGMTVGGVTASVSNATCNATSLEFAE
ncbi:zinc ribbon domain-containing protein [Gilvimarinus agarilyticus]|uniref:hypothetical protein n=1 Tax=Gilvimarinus agarilyticus TaxID=679259 RepID=UPI0005A02F2C|nr:hypothetical protein [Gilvimarinus agarilyticus]